MSIDILTDGVKPGLQQLLLCGGVSNSRQGRKFTSYHFHQSISVPFGTTQLDLARKAFLTTKNTKFTKGFENQEKLHSFLYFSSCSSCPSWWIFSFL